MKGSKNSKAAFNGVDMSFLEEGEKDGDSVKRDGSAKAAVWQQLTWLRHLHPFRTILRYLHFWKFRNTDRLRFQLQVVI